MARTPGQLARTLLGTRMYINSLCFPVCRDRPCDASVFHVKNHKQSILIKLNKISDLRNYIDINRHKHGLTGECVGR
jgi:hypothetical protein